LWRADPAQHVREPAGHNPACIAGPGAPADGFGVPHERAAHAMLTMLDAREPLHVGRHDDVADANLGGRDWLSARNTARACAFVKPHGHPAEERETAFWRGFIQADMRLLVVHPGGSGTSGSVLLSWAFRRA
jgi:hypothetical protein